MSTVARPIVIIAVFKRFRETVLSIFGASRKRYQRSQLACWWTKQEVEVDKNLQGKKGI